MREFFHGWRRKAGVVTLVMACVLSVAWCRSHQHLECVYIILNGSHFNIRSSTGCVGIVLYTVDDDKGFHIDHYVAPDPSWARGAPYWSLVLPLTLLSTYLLLWKPRKRA